MLQPSFTKIRQPTAGVGEVPSAALTFNKLLENGGNKELLVFLTKAIAFLKDEANEFYHRQVVNYLMGVEKSLPVGLDRPHTEICPDVKYALRSFLNPPRYDHSGEFAQAQQIPIVKLEELHFRLSFSQWVKDAPDAERYGRNKASIAIQRCIKTNGTVLDLEGLRLTSFPPLPANLMNHLEELFLGDNRFTSLVGLSAKMDALKNLDLSNNYLTSLDGLPEQMDALERLDLSYNQITSLVGLPEQMDALERMDLRYNQLTSLAGIPQSVLHGRNAMIALTSNPLNTDTIDIINNLIAGVDAIVYFHMVDQKADLLPAKSLVAAVTEWFGADTGVLWNDHEENPAGPQLATLLSRLPESECFKGLARDGSIKELKAILELMLTDEVFRAYCFDAAQASDRDCEDNVQAIFDDLRMQLANPAIKEGGTLAKVVEFQRGRLAAKLIETYVMTLGTEGEPLSSGLYLKYKLSEKLELPIIFNMFAHPQTAVVSNALDLHINAAEEYVVKNLTPDLLRKAMLDDPACVEFLTKTNLDKFAVHNSKWVDALGEAQGNTLNVAGVGTGSRLETARKMQLGDGREFLKLQEVARGELLQKIALDAVALHGKFSGGF